MQKVITLNISLELLFQLFPTILIVIVVLNACEQCLEQVRYIGFLLHNIEKDIDDNKINTLVKLLLLLLFFEFIQVKILIKLSFHRRKISLCKFCMNQ